MMQQVSLYIQWYLLLLVWGVLGTAYQSSENIAYYLVSALGGSIGGVMCAAQGSVNATSGWRLGGTPGTYTGMCFAWVPGRVRSGTDSGVSSEYNLSRKATTYPSISLSN